MPDTTDRDAAPDPLYRTMIDDGIVTEGPTMSDMPERIWANECGDWQDDSDGSR